MRRAPLAPLTLAVTLGAAFASGAHPASAAGASAATATATAPAPAGSSASASGTSALAASPLVARGQQLFDDQQYEESLQVLSAALVRPGNSVPQRIEIYRLLALDYITLDRRDEAESACRGIFSLAPTYNLPERESPRFRDYFAAAKRRWEAEGRPGLVTPAESAGAAVTMRHASPPSATAHSDIPLSARLDDRDHRVTQVKLFYRSGSHGLFTSLLATVSDGAVTATVPRSAVKPPIVEYYLQGTDASGLAVVSRGDAAAPLRVAIPDSSSGWVLPVAIGGSVLGAGAIVGVLALAGVFKSSSHPGHSGMPPTSTVTVSVGDSRRLSSP